MDQQINLTQLLVAWRAGDERALDRLMGLAYSNLRQLAGHYMRAEKASHTLQATALVHEAFVKMVDADISWQNRAHFMALAARTMRRILVDHARAKAAGKRGGDVVAVTLHETRVGGEDGINPDVLAVEEALQRLNEIDPRKAQVVELSFYGGLTYDEIAEVLAVSPATVDRELRFAKAWLYRRLSSGQQTAAG